MKHMPTNKKSILRTLLPAIALAVGGVLVTLNVAYADISNLNDDPLWQLLTAIAVALMLYLTVFVLPWTFIIISPLSLVFLLRPRITTPRVVVPLIITYVCSWIVCVLYSIQMQGESFTDIIFFDSDLLHLTLPWIAAFLIGSIALGWIYRIQKKRLNNATLMPTNKKTTTKTFYVTTPIYYVNDVPHIGHAYTTVAADVLARYWRTQLGPDNVYFLTGTDEHGVKIQQAAEKAGVDPQRFCDEKSAKFQEAWDALDISNNDFIRTTDQRHKDIVVWAWEKLRTAMTPKGRPALYEEEYSGLYCVGCESYKTETELVNGLCPDHKKEPIHLKEKNWFFRLSDYTEILRDYVENDLLRVGPASKKSEILGLINQGLKDVAVSRRNVQWGIPVPFDTAQTTYVWIDALMNYVSALGGPRNMLCGKFWPANVHLMAKDILKFHAAIWPAMLIALDMPLPQQVFAHGFFTIDGQKMSKTLGNVVNPNDVVQLYGSDAARYLLLSQFGFGTDGDISLARFQDIYASHLANALGNLVSRTVAMTEKYFAGAVPRSTMDDRLSTFDLSRDWHRYDFHMRELQFDEALKVIWDDVRACNEYIEQQKPWELAKNEDMADALTQTMYHLLETIRHVALMLLPFTPGTSGKILTQLGFDAATYLQKPMEELREWGGLQGGEKLVKGEILFPRLEANKE